MRKRTTENISNLKKVANNLNSRKSSFLRSGTSLNFPLSSPQDFSCYTSINSISEIIEDVVDKVNLSIKRIEQKKYFGAIMGRSINLSMEVENSIVPIIATPEDTGCAESEPERIPLDHVCQRDKVIEKQKVAKRSRSNLSLFNESVSSQKREKPAVPSNKTIQKSKSNKFIALENAQSLKDLNVVHFQTVYRERYERQSIRLIKEAPQVPNLLTSKKGRAEGDSQYNFDYNGDKILISGGVVLKNNQINVLKTTYRINKDKQEEIRSPKKVLERISFNRFPSILNKKPVGSFGEIGELKSCIEKSFDQKVCKLTSIKTIKQDL